MMQWIQAGLLSPDVMHSADRMTGVLSTVCITGSCVQKATTALVKIQNALGDIKVCHWYTDCQMCACFQPCAHRH